MSKSTEKTPSQEPTIQEAEYTAQELAAAAEAVFKTKPECVIAAFRVAGIDKATKTKAKEIVTNFLAKEVK